MKLGTLTVLFLAISFLSFTPVDKKFPSSDIKDLNGKVVNTNEFVNNGKITIVSFWATWCVPCQRELDIYSDLYEEWQEKYDVEIVAISTDNARQLTKVKPLVAQKQWEFQILNDPNGKLMQSLNFVTIPQTFILDKNGNIVFDHNGFAMGDEYEVEDVLEKLTKE